MNPGAVLALDVGTGKIGLAVTDAGRRLAFPLDILPRRSVKKDAEALAVVCRAREVTALVCGLPPDPRLAHLARQVGDALASLTGLPVTYVDESWTSAEARGRLDDAGLPRHRIDAVAAQVILEVWMRGDGV